MKALTRRDFLTTSLATGFALSMPSICRSAAAADPVRLAIVGLGGINIPGSVGGRGRQLIDVLRKMPQAKIVALCDADRAVLDHSLKDFKDRGETVASYSDIRKLLEDKSVDAVVIALPNHWHSLATVWACQAGKDVYVEKPFSYNLWEGRQAVAAARKYKRMVQVGMQNHSSAVLKEAFDYLGAGQLGAVRYAHALVYRPREGIAMVNTPKPPPATLDYDLWCGPSPIAPLRREHLHYEWHWFWGTGNGEIGNNGVHMIDLSRWALGKNQLPPRTMSFGGRYATHDNAETPNTQVAFFDYRPAPLICEVRNVKAPGSAHGIGKFRNADHGVIIVCENGHLAGDASGATAFDSQGKKVKEFKNQPGTPDLEVAHFSSFFDAIRSRNNSGLVAEALQGHLSAGCCHLGNVSYRLGKTADPKALQEAAAADKELLDTYERCREDPRENGVDLAATPAVCGPWVTLNPANEQFDGPLAAQATQLSKREYRPPFVVPQVA